MVRIALPGPPFTVPKKNLWTRPAIFEQSNDPNESNVPNDSNDDGPNYTSGRRAPGPRSSKLQRI